MENQIIKVLAEASGCDPEEISRITPILSLGFDSLEWIGVVFDLEQLGYDLDISNSDKSHLASLATVGDVVDFLMKKLACRTDLPLVG